MFRCIVRKPSRTGENSKEQKKMSEDLIIRTLTALMLDQREITAASARQEERYAELIRVMTEFTETSTETRKRLSAVEAAVSELQKKAS